VALFSRGAPTRFGPPRSRTRARVTRGSRSVLLQTRFTGPSSRPEGPYTQSLGGAVPRSPKGPWPFHSRAGSKIFRARPTRPYTQTSGGSNPSNLAIIGLLPKGKASVIETDNSHGFLTRARGARWLLGALLRTTGPGRRGTPVLPAFTLPRRRGTRCVRPSLFRAVEALAASGHHSSAPSRHSVSPASRPSEVTADNRVHLRSHSSAPARRGPTRNLDVGGSNPPECQLALLAQR